jgi:hypothetical protein
MKQNSRLKAVQKGGNAEKELGVPSSFFNVASKRKPFLGKVVIELTFFV